MATKSKQNPASTPRSTFSEDDVNSVDVPRPSFSQSSSRPGLVTVSTPRRRSTRQRKGPKKILSESPCESEGSRTPGSSKMKRSGGSGRSAAKTRPKSKPPKKVPERPSKVGNTKLKSKGRAISVVEMKNFIASLKSLQLSVVLQSVLSFLSTEEHIKKRERDSIINGLKVSNQLSELVKVVFQKGIQLLSSGLKNRAEDRQAMYRINFTFFLRSLIFGPSSNEKETIISKWFKENFSGMTIEHLSCVVHAVGSGVYDFIQMQALKFNQKNENVITHVIGGGDNHSENLLASLLVVAGGCLGKIQKVMKNFQRKNYRTKDKVLKSKLEMYRVIRKLLWNIVMTSKEKRNPCLPQTVKQRDRGFMFIPKWVFLTYLRMLDRCVSQTATQNGVELYGKNLMKVL